MKHKMYDADFFSFFTWGCFTEDTVIHMADGSMKSLCSIEKDDWVFGLHENSILYPDNPRWDIWQTTDIEKSTIVKNQIVNIEYLKDDTILVINNDLKITKHHPVLCKKKASSVWSWVSSEDLAPEDFLLNDKKEPTLIYSCVWESGSYNTVNIQVSGTGNYFVGKSAVLAHNFDHSIKHQHRKFIDEYLL